MLQSAVELELFPIENFLAPVNIELADVAVAEIFKLMFGYDIEMIDVSLLPLGPQLEERTAIVGFSGSMRGSCQIRMSTSAARSIATAMLGDSLEDDDNNSVNDALGELCNMLAGGWKNGISELSSACALSPPTVISGSDYKVHLSQPSYTISRAYRFDSHTFQLMLCREEGVSSRA
jgi:chemotaxis protein CheX